MAQKETNEVIRQFKNDNSSCWFMTKHWRVIDGKLTLCAGGLFEQAEYDRVYKYFKNKKLI